MAIKKRKFKRGISPLIATVLLVGFTIVLIILVIIWGRNYIAERAEKEGILSELKLKCSTDVKIRVVDVGVDIEEKYVELENIGGTTIESFTFRSKLDRGNVETKTYKDSLNSGEIEKYHFDSNAVEVDIIPQLRPEGRGAPRIPCSDQHVVIKP